MPAAKATPVPFTGNVDENGMVAVAPTSWELAGLLKELGCLGGAVAIGFMGDKPKFITL